MPSIFRKFMESKSNVLMARNIMWLLFDKVLRMLCGVVIIFWMARHFGPENFGLLNYTIALVAIFTVISSFGLNSIVVRDLVRSESEKLEILGSAFFLKIIASIVSYFLLIAMLLIQKPTGGMNNYIVAILGTTIVFQSLNVVKFWFESKVQSKYIVWVENSVFVLFACIKGLALWLGGSLTTIIVILAIEVFVSSLLLMIVYSKQEQSVFAWRFNKKRILQLLKDSWPLALSASIGTILLKIDQIMIMDMLGSESVGLYSAASKISEIWYIIPGIIASTVFPSLLKAQSQSQSVYMRKLGRLYDFMVMSSLLIAVPVSIYSAEIIALLYGDKYAGAAGVLSIHIWCGVFVYLRTASAQWFISNNLQVFSLYRSLTAVVLNVVLNYFLIPIWGMEGAAYAVLISLFWSTYGFTFLHAKMRPCFMMQTKALLFYSTFNLIKRKVF